MKLEMMDKEEFIEQFCEAFAYDDDLVLIAEKVWEFGNEQYRRGYIKDVTIQTLRTAITRIK